MDRQAIRHHLQGTKKTPTTYAMDEATALARFRDAERIDSSLKWRDLPETDEESSELHRRGTTREP